MQILTVQDLANAWLLDGVALKDGNAELQRRFNKDLLPVLGKTPVNNVSEPVANHSAYRQAISFFADLTQMFSWARKRQPWRTLLVEGDLPIDQWKEAAIPTAAVTPHAFLLRE